MSRFVRPDKAILKISDGDTLVVKRRLTHGERRQSFARMYVAGVDGTFKTDPLNFGMALVTAYLLDWSLKDDAGQPVVIRDQSADTVMGILDALEPESFLEIKTAIEAHESAMLQERFAEKNALDGEKE